MSRRTFLRQATWLGAAGMTATLARSPHAAAGPRRVSANDRLQIGLIGAGGMGQGNLANCAAHADVVVTAVCDVWQERREAVCAQYPTAKPYADYRAVLERGDVDAVIIATPPHWHCRMAVDACEAGKDLYIQKPMSLHVAESLAIRNAVAKHGRISQIGTQIHAGENYRRVVERIRSGQLGPVSVVRTFNVMNQGPEGIGNPPNCDPPPGLDWNQWVGPAPLQPYNPLITRSAYENCSFMNFSGGWTPGMAPHIIDLPFWALELGVPIRTSCTGGRHILQDAGDAPDVQEVVWEFPTLVMTWSMSVVNSFGFDFGRGEPARRLGIYFHAVNGTLFADYGMHQVVPEGDRLKDTQPPPPSIAPSPGHEREWLDCLRTREQPSCCVDYHYRIDLAINLANLAMRLRRDLRWDPAGECIADDAEAARLTQPEYRQPWCFPAEYVA
ncbi:MAG: Gfo/Idh/MocA family oxidoreductase [Pirellulaceae bacterium]|nr:Gfo/Idh/MocA family oxidoreductase [Pirellulaceae bacterium]